MKKLLKEAGASQRNRQVKDIEIPRGKLLFSFHSWNPVEAEPSRNKWAQNQGANRRETAVFLLPVGGVVHRGQPHRHRASWRTDLVGQ